MLCSQKQLDMHTMEFTNINMMLQWHKDKLISWCFQEMGSSSKLFSSISIYLSVPKWEYRDSVRLIYCCFMTLSENLQKISNIRNGSCRIIVHRVHRSARASSKSPSCSTVNILDTLHGPLRVYLPPADRLQSSYNQISTSPRCSTSDAGIPLPVWNQWSHMTQHLK